MADAESEAGNIPRMRGLNGRCKSCSADLLIDMNGLTVKTDISCPSCGEVSQLSRLAIERARAKLDKIVRKLGSACEGDPIMEEIRAAHTEVITASPAAAARVHLLPDT